MTTWQGAFASVGQFGATVNPTARYGGSFNSVGKAVDNVTAIESATLSAEVQKFSLEALVTLFMIDASAIGGSIYRFTGMTNNGQVVIWNDEEYAPLANQSDGWEIPGNGNLPTPKLRVSNIGGLIGNLCITLDDLVGAVVTRYRTFGQFIDGGSSADPTIYFEPDIFRIERKTIHTKEMVEFELASALDVENVYLPARVVLKYNCTQFYRLWNTALDGGAGAFDYSHATCPFNGTQNGNLYYDENGTLVTNPSQDVCGRLVSDCKLRFPGQPLPTWAFPGVGAAGVG